MSCLLQIVPEFLVFSDHLTYLY